MEKKLREFAMIDSSLQPISSFSTFSLSFVNLPRKSFNCFSNVFYLRRILKAFSLFLFLFQSKRAKGLQIRAERKFESMKSFSINVRNEGGRWRIFAFNEKAFRGIDEGSVGMNGKKKNRGRLKMKMNDLSLPLEVRQDSVLWFWISIVAFLFSPRLIQSSIVIRLKKLKTCGFLI
jgi:hypothetical protein